MNELWSADYEVVRLLKEDGPRQTYLLEKRGEPWRRVLCKQSFGRDGELLQREYEIWKALQGSDRLLELREGEDVCCLLRDYIPGTTLEAVIQRDGPMTGPETARLGIELCGTLGALHAMTPPVIHRDLKPDNILLTETGRVRLIDLGAARTYKPGQEEDTTYLGTRGYAAPEQYGSGQTDVRTDVFGLGKVLAYALAGEYVDTPPRLTGRDRALRRILDRCCAYDPARRWQDMGRLKKALERYLSRRAIPVRGLALGACAAALICGVALWGGYELGRRAPAPSPSVEVSGWDPFRRESDVMDIVRCMDTKDYAAMAAGCEKLVTALTEEPLVRAAEPVAYWEMDQQALNDYYGSRQSYEYIADNLAYGDGLAVRRLGTYEAAMPAFAQALQARIDYLWTDETGTRQTSALYMLTVDGDNRNIDGCVIEILDELNKALDKTPAP